MNHQATTAAKGFRRKLALTALAIGSVGLAGVAAGPALQAAGLKEAPGQEKRNFTISGELTTELSPGVSAPLDLTFHNPNQQALRVEELRVAVVGTSSAACQPDNFSATQFSGSYSIPISRGSSKLSTPVPESSKWPRVAMINKPTVNQDACKGVTVNLAYNGVASK